MPPGQRATASSSWKARGPTPGSEQRHKLVSSRSLTLVGSPAKKAKAQRKSPKWTQSRRELVEDLGAEAMFKHGRKYTDKLSEQRQKDKAGTGTGHPSASSRPDSPTPMGSAEVRTMAAGGTKPVRASWLKTQKPKVKRTMANTPGDGGTSNRTCEKHGFAEENWAVSTGGPPPEGNPDRGDAHSQSFGTTF